MTSEENIIRWREKEMSQVEYKTLNRNAVRSLNFHFPKLFLVFVLDQHNIKHYPHLTH